MQKGSLVKFIQILKSSIIGQINLPSQALWDGNGTTVAGRNNTTSGSSYNQLNGPAGISITNNDVLYVSDTNNHRIVVVDLNYTANTSIIGSGPGNNIDQFNYPRDLFVTNTSLYVIDMSNYRVKKLSLNGSNPSTLLNFSGSPYYFYIDQDENIYLSDQSSHRVVLYRSNSTNYTLVAGTGAAGSNNNQLYVPYGVFVNRNGTIYIADSGNHRIMKWFAGTSSGLIVAGNGTLGTSATQLSYPTQVMLDKNEYLYICENGNSRITRWNPNSTFGVCIAGCTGTSGTAANQLRAPVSFTFDRYGSLYVSDYLNNRVQKFQILCYQSTY